MMQWWWVCRQDGVARSVSTLSDPSCEEKGARCGFPLVIHPSVCNHMIGGGGNGFHTAAAATAASSRRSVGLLPLAGVYWILDRWDEVCMGAVWEGSAADLIRNDREGLQEGMDAVLLLLPTPPSLPSAQAAAHYDVG